MKLASLIFGDEPTKKADSKKLSSLEPGQIVRTIDGSAYRVASKTASPKGTAYRLADLQGKPVPTPADFRPVGLAMARFASWLRYHLAYNKDFDMYVNSYIEKYNSEHPDNQLPYPVGPDGKPFRWADWFQRSIASKLYVNLDPGQAQAMKDEVIHEMLFTVLGQRRAIDKFAEKIKRFNKNDKVKNMDTARQLTVYLTSIFGHKHRLMEMQGLLKEQQPEQEMSMIQPGIGEEGDEGSEQNILDTEEHAVGTEAFESAEAQKDITKFRDTFGHWLKGKFSEKVANSFLVLFDIYWHLISQSGEDNVEDVEKSKKQKKKDERKSWMISRSDLEPLWAERTGLSFGSMKDYLGRLPGLMEEFITSHATALGQSNIFVSLMNAIKKETGKAKPAKASVAAAEPEKTDIQKQMDAEYALRGKSDKWFKLRDQQHNRQPEKQAAGVEGDFSEALRNTENPDNVDKDIKQLTVSVPDAAGVKVAWEDEEDEMEEETIEDRLEYLRSQLQAESISTAELMELQGLAEYIDPGDVELLEAAGVEEFFGHDKTYNPTDEEKQWMQSMGIRGSAKTAKLIAGNSLTPEMREQVVNAFPYRWTHENAQRLNFYEACPSCDIKNPHVNEQTNEGHNHPTIPLISDDQWIREHAFNFTLDGRLGRGHAQPAYLAQHNARRVATVNLKFAVEKAAYNPFEKEATETGNYACCGGRGSHKDGCSVKGTDSASKKTSSCNPDCDFYDAEWCKEHGKTADAYDEPVDMTDAYAINKAQSKPPLEALTLYLDKEDGSVHVALDSEAEQTFCGKTIGHSALQGYHDNTMIPTNVAEVEELERAKGGIWCPWCLDEYDGDSGISEPEHVGSVEKEAMIGHMFNNADGQAIRNETYPDTGDVSGESDTTEFRQPRVGGGTQECCGAFKPKHKENCKQYNENFDRTTRSLGLKSGAGSNSGKDDARGAGDNWREEFYESREIGPSADALGLTKSAQGAGNTTVTMQEQNATFPNTPGKGQPMAVPEPIDQQPGPHSPNAPSTAPRTPNIQPRIVNVPAGTDQEGGVPMTASEDADWESMHPSDDPDMDYDCPKCRGMNTEIEAEADGGYSVYCNDCDEITETVPGEAQPRTQGEVHWHGPELSRGSDFSDDENEKFKTFMKSLGASKNAKTEEELMEEAEIMLQKQGAAVPPTTVSPNVVQNQNINRPLSMPQQNPVSVALMPGQQEQDQGGGGSGYGQDQPSKRTIQPELSQSEFLMREGSVDRGLFDLVASEMVKLGGGTDFYAQATGKTVQEAFSKAVDEARYEKGHGGYSGTVAEKSGYVLTTPPKGYKPDQWIEMVRRVRFEDEVQGDTISMNKKVEVKPGSKCPKCGKGKVELVPATFNPPSSGNMTRDAERQKQMEAWAAENPQPKCNSCGAKSWDLYSESRGSGKDAKYYTYKKTKVKVAPDVMAQLKRDGEVFDDKWGPALAVQLAKNKWLFCGIASS